MVAWGFGEIYARPALAARDRQLVTLGMLTALGGCEPQLEVHINAALNVGLTPIQIIESLLHSAVYCGMPRALTPAAFNKRSPGTTAPHHTGGSARLAQRIEHQPAQISRSTI